MILPAVNVFLVFTVASATDRPILGILAQETQLPFSRYGTSYINAAYVKAVEASGARVVPIFINKTGEFYENILGKLNGVVLPGGSADLEAPHGHAEAGYYIFNIAIRMNMNGRYFPILGVCQGYHLLMFLANNRNASVLTRCECFKALPLEFKDDFRNSLLFGNASDDIIDILRTRPVTSNHHRFCVKEETLKDLSLDHAWSVISTNVDKHGLEFISSSESFVFPFVGVQFHPEKNIYEWNRNQTMNPHGPEAVVSGRYFYDWIVEKARRNNHSFDSLEEETDNLIYNYNTVYLGRQNGYIEQAYFFMNPEDQFFQKSDLDL